MGLLQVANLVLPLLTMPIIARIVGPEKLGAINYAAALIAYFTLLINYSYELTATREVAQVKRKPAPIECAVQHGLPYQISLVCHCHGAVCYNLSWHSRSSGATAG